MISYREACIFTLGARRVPRQLRRPMARRMIADGLVDTDGKVLVRCSAESIRAVVLGHSFKLGDYVFAGLTAQGFPKYSRTFQQPGGSRRIRTGFIVTPEIAKC